MPAPGTRGAGPPGAIALAHVPAGDLSRVRSPRADRLRRHAARHADPRVLALPAGLRDRVRPNLRGAARSGTQAQLPERGRYPRRLSRPLRARAVASSRHLVATARPPRPRRVQQLARREDGRRGERRLDSIGLDSVGRCSALWPARRDARQDQPDGDGRRPRLHVHRVPAGGRRSEDAGAARVRPPRVHDVGAEHVRHHGLRRARRSRARRGRVPRRRGRSQLARRAVERRHRRVPDRRRVHRRSRPATTSRSSTR